MPTTLETMADLMPEIAHGGTLAGDHDATPVLVAPQCASTDPEGIFLAFLFLADFLRVGHSKPNYLNHMA
jgi:hypothetical protein